jgi:hypothetical protein
VIRQSIDDRLASYSQELSTIPHQPTGKPILRLQTLCNNLSQELKSHARTAPGFESLMQEIRFGHFKTFTDEIMKTKPKFFIDTSDIEEYSDEKIIQDEERAENSIAIPPMNLTQLRKHIETYVIFGRY